MKKTEIRFYLKEEEHRLIKRRAEEVDMSMKDFIIFLATNFKVERVVKQL